jgi:hypothetical protein
MVWARFFPLASLVFLVGIGTAVPRRARAQENGAARIELLNRRAMQEYDLLEFEAARKALTDALAVVKKSGLEADPVAAKTYVHLGIVYVAGLKDRYRGFQQFVKALQINPSIRLDPALATPELQEVFDNARDTVGVPRTAATSPKPPVEKPQEKTEKKPDEATVGQAKGLQHRPIDEAPAGKPLDVSAEVGSDVQAARVFLFYRGPGREDFASLPMTKEKRGSYVATIPAEAVTGRAIQYYIEARDSRGKPLVDAGSASSPNIITVVAAAQAAGGREENPLLRGSVDHGGGGDVSKKSDEGAAGRHSIWLTAAVGSGVGLATGKADLESNINIATGVAPSVLHIAPELGLFVSESVAISLQGRLQVLTLADPKDPNGSTAAKGALAGFGRVLYYFSRDRFRAYLAFAVGAGELRHTVDISTATKRTSASDTVVAGPFLFGPGVGFHWDFSERVGFVTELQGIIGADQFTAHGDLNLGLSFNL